MLKDKKVFVSSTCYDLPDLRAFLEDHLNNEGAVTLLSDRSNFPCDIGQHRHDACINMVSKCDLFILIIDKRVGAPYYKDKSISITRAEFRAAIAAKRLVLVFVRRNIMDERLTWSKNSNLTGFQPAFVENISVFEFISEVQSDPSGVWIQPFDNVLEIKQKLTSLESIPNSVLDLSKLQSTPQPKLVDGKIDLQSFSKETQHYILSLNPYNSLNDLFEIEQIRKCSDAIPESETQLGILLDFELGSLGIKDIVGVNPIRPAEDDGSSWYVSIFPTALGKSIKQELSAFLSAF